MYKLFYADGSAAMGIRTILEEIGAEYELIETNIAYQTPRDPDLLELNPNGWVPVLIWEDGAMYECAAITMSCVLLFAGDRARSRNPGHVQGSLLTHTGAPSCCLQAK